jgi:type I restriction enzyme S subunit
VGELWKDYKLGEVAEFINGRAFKPSEWETSGKLIIRIQDLTGSINDPHFSTKSFDPKYLVRKHDLLISWSATLDAYIWAKEDAWLNQHIFKVKENPKIITRKFLFFLIKKEIDAIKRQVHGSTMKHITKPRFTSTKIRIPSIETQEKIVETIEKAEQLQQWRKESDKLTNDYLNGIFLKLFGDPLNNPKKWRTFPLEELCCKNRKITYGIVQPGNSVKSGVSIVRSSDLLDDYISLKGLKEIDPKIEDRSPRSRLKGGELLVSVRGTIGPVAIAIKELRNANVSRGVAILDPSDKIKVEYLFGLFRLPVFRKWLDGFARGIALRQLNLNILRLLKIPLPPIELQEKYSTFLGEIKEIQDYQINAKEQIQDFFNRINQALEAEPYVG